MIISHFVMTAYAVYCSALSPQEDVFFLTILILCIIPTKTL